MKLKEPGYIALHVRFHPFIEPFDDDAETFASVKSDYNLTIRLTYIFPIQYIFSVGGNDVITDPPQIDLDISLFTELYIWSIARRFFEAKSQAPHSGLGGLISGYSSIIRSASSFIISSIRLGRSS
jgi:hypothetical protein